MGGYWKNEYRGYKMKFKKLSIFLSIFMVAAMVYAGSQQTSSTLASTIITNARYHLNDTTTSAASSYFWLDAELLVWVNQGTLDIATRTRCLEGTENISLTPGTVEYSITSNYIDVSTVVYGNSTSVKKGLVRKNPQTIGNDPDDPNITEPVYWYEWAGKVGAFPALSTGTGIITIYYVSRPSTVTSGQAVYVPAVYDRALTLYVAAQAFLKSGQYAKSGRLMSEYLAELDRYRTDFVERTQEPEGNIKKTQ